MSGNEIPDFDSLPPLPKEHIWRNGAKQQSKKYSGSKNETDLDGGKIDKVIPVKGNNISDAEHYKIETEDEKTKMEEIVVPKVISIKVEQLSDSNTEHSNTKQITQNIDETLAKFTEKLGLHSESAQDGETVGNISTKFSSFGASRFKILNSSVKADAENYMMNHSKRGHCLIFNNSEFESQTQLNPRNGTNQDRDALKILFTELGFDVHTFDNLKLSALYSKLNQFAYGTDHRNNDCLVVFFLSHGEEDLLYATDYAFESQKLFMHFTADNCSSLAGKPKIFFVQACRGSGVDDGVTLYHNNKDQTDYSSSSFFKIPVHADFLISYSTVGAHFSWRNTINGSWFIQSIVKVFRERAALDDVLSMMTSVNRRMIIDFESNCPSNPDMHAKKQTACIRSTLMRKIFLLPQQ